MDRRSLNSLSSALVLCCLAAAPCAADGSVVVDAAYTLFRRTVTLECAYEAPCWFASASVGGWYWPSYPTGLEGYAMDRVFDGDLRLSAGYAVRLGPAFSIRLGAYAGAWAFHSAEAIAVDRYGLALSGSGFQFAPRAGLSAEMRWFAFGPWGLGLGLSVPWQLFSFTSLGLSEALPLIGVRLGACVRLDT